MKANERISQVIILGGPVVAFLKLGKCPLALMPGGGDAISRIDQIAPGQFEIYLSDLQGKRIYLYGTLFLQNYFLLTEPIKAEGDPDGKHAKKA